MKNLSSSWAALFTEAVKINFTLNLIIKLRILHRKSQTCHFELKLGSTIIAAMSHTAFILMGLGRYV